MRKLEKILCEDIDLEDTTYCARLDFPEEQILSLSKLIDKDGLRNPPGYIRIGSRLIVNFGWRRTFAIQRLGWDSFDAWVYTDLDEKDAHLQNISDNIDREQLSTLEIAKKVKILKDDVGIPVEEIAERMGKGTQHIYDLVRLTTMPEKIQYAVHKEEINLYHAIEIFKFPVSKYLEILAQCVTEKWSVGFLKRMRQGGSDQEILTKREQMADRIVADAAEKGVVVNRDDLLKKLSNSQQNGRPKEKKVWLTHKGWVVDIPYDWKERQEKRLGEKITFVSVEENEDGSLMIKVQGGDEI